MKQLNASTQANTSPFTNNPVLVQLLGLSPVLAISTTAVNSIALAAATFIVTVLSCTLTAALRHYLIGKWRLVSYLLILALFTSIIDSLISVFRLPLHKELGMYLSLIACNSALVLRMELFARHNSCLSSAIDACKTACGFAVVILLMGFVREVLSTGSLFAKLELLLPQSAITELIIIPTSGDNLLKIFSLQPGALICLGILIAISNYFISSSHSRKTEVSVDPNIRVRITNRS